MSLQIVQYRGDDREYVFTLTADDVPVDLTGVTEITFTGRTAADFDSTDAPALALSLTDTDIAIDGDPTTGIITVTVPSADTVNFETPLTLLCDVQVTFADGTKRTWPDALYGQSSLIRLRVRGDVTR